MIGQITQISEVKLIGINQKIFLSLLVIIGIVFSLLISYVSNVLYLKSYSIISYFLSFYLGWVVSATILNGFIVLVYKTALLSKSLAYLINILSVPIFYYLCGKIYYQWIRLHTNCFDFEDYKNINYEGIGLLLSLSWAVFGVTFKLLG